MNERKNFHLGDLLSVTHGRLVSPSHISGVYAVVDFVTGQPHFTHQLPRASEEVRPELLRQHPWLAAITIPDSVTDESSVMSWLSWAVGEYGEMHEIEALPSGAYVGREPMTEWREMAPHAQIIGVQLPPVSGSEEEGSSDD